MEFWIKAGQLILSLSILVVFHELGHFTFAKLFKTRVEKFYLFFDPWFSLVKFKKGETEYGIGWLPLGGYVKIAGMIDESMDKEQLAKDPEPWEFRSKKTWQRLLIMIGGVLVNIILAFVIYIGILYTWGEEVLPNKNIANGVVCDSAALKMGLQHEDKIIALDGKEITYFNDIVPELLLNEPKTITVERNGENVKIDVPKNFTTDMIKSQKARFIMPAYPFVIDSVLPGAPAQKAGLKKNDQIIGINQQKLLYFPQYPNVLLKHKEDTVKLTVVRDADTLIINSYVSGGGKIGVGVKSMFDYFELEKIEYGILAAVPAGIKKGTKQLGDYVKQLKLIFNPETEAYKQLGGFGSIGNLFPATWDWYSFWMLTAFLSIILGVMNILPIPALDGGHVMFLLYEMITGRKPGDKFLEYAQMVGMILLLALVVYANANDIVKFLIK